VNIDTTIAGAFDLLRASQGDGIYFRIGRLEKVLRDHRRTRGCLHGEQCRTYQEARRILADARVAEAVSAR
jgi:hypothetical protein